MKEKKRQNANTLNIYKKLNEIMDILPT